MAGDSLQPAYPNNTHKQDWAYYPFIGGRGGGSLLPAAPVERYSFWVDFDPFDIKNLKMLSQNVSFAIYNDTYGDIPLIPYYIIAQSNDMSDALIEAHLPTTPGQTVSVQTAVGQFSLTYPLVGFVDNGSTQPFTGDFPPASTFQSITASISDSAQGDLGAGITYYYWLQWQNGATQYISQALSATTTEFNQTIGITYTPITGVSDFVIYRNTVNNSATAIYLGTSVPGQPPYYINTTFTSQPSNENFQNDQGSYTFDGYIGNGFGFGGTTMLTQGFVPTQPQLTGFFFAGIFNNVASNTSLYSNINFELWNSSNQFVQHLGTVHPTYNPALTTTAGLTVDSSVTSVSYQQLEYNTYSGINYWNNISQLGLKFAKPVSVTVGSTYYIVARLATLTGGTNYYFLGMNTLNTGLRNALYSYPFASAYQATDGSSTWSQLVDSGSNPITFPFITQGNHGRYATTYWWANLGTVYWGGTPNANEYSYLHIDYNQRI